jgi:hypothetical protein
MHNAPIAAQAKMFLIHSGIAASPYLVLPNSLARPAFTGKYGLWLSCEMAVSAGVIVIDATRDA